MSSKRNSNDDDEIETDESEIEDEEEEPSEEEPSEEEPSEEEPSEEEPSEEEFSEEEPSEDEPSEDELSEEEDISEELSDNDFSDEETKKKITKKITKKPQGSIPGVIPSNVPKGLSHLIFMLNPPLKDKVQLLIKNPSLFQEEQFKDQIRSDLKNITISNLRDILININVPLNGLKLKEHYVKRFIEFIGANLPEGVSSPSKISANVPPSGVLGEKTIISIPPILSSSLKPSPKEISLKPSPKETSLESSPKETSLKPSPKETSLKSSPKETSLKGTLPANKVPLAKVVPKIPTKDQNIKLTNIVLSKPKSKMEGIIESKTQLPLPVIRPRSPGSLTDKQITVPDVLLPLPKSSSEGYPKISLSDIKMTSFSKVQLPTVPAVLPGLIKEEIHSSVGEITEPAVPSVKPLLSLTLNSVYINPKILGTLKTQSADVQEKYKRIIGALSDPKFLTLSLDEQKDVIKLALHKHVSSELQTLVKDILKLTIPAKGRAPKKDEYVDTFINELYS
jgi:hypothetical protein